MVVKKSDFGYIVWLTEEEMNCQAVAQEIERLKALGKVALFYSGSLELMQVIKRLLQENKELMNL